MLHTLFTILSIAHVNADVFRESPSFDGKLRNATDGTMEAYMIPPFKSNHASFVQPCPNGDTVMAWFSGSAEGYSDVAIVVSRLPSGSDQWTKASVVSQRKKYSNQNPVLFYDNQTKVLYLFHTQQEAKKIEDYTGEVLRLMSFVGTNPDKASVVSQRKKYSNQNPVLFYDNQTKTLYLFQTQQEAKKIDDYTGEESATIWELQSADYGVTWSDPKIMFAKAGSFDRNRVVVSLRNSWLYPIYYAGGSRKDTSYLKESTSHRVFDTWLEHYFTGSDHLVQPTVVRPIQNSTKLISFFRDRRAESIYRATSGDDGVTWSQPARTKLPNNNSGIEATVLMSGHLAIVYNPTNKDRNPLEISISEDEGMTWTHTRALEDATGANGVEFSYPTLFQDSAGRIHVSYTYNRDTIKYRVLPGEAWVAQRK